VTNHNYNGKAVTIKHDSVCLYSCLRYVAWKLHLSYYIVIYGLFGCMIFFNIIEHKMCVFTFCTSFVCSFSHSEKNSARYHHWT